MFAIIASFRVQPEHVAAFIEASLDDARGSVRDEPGCRRFDVIQGTDDDSRLWFYEVYDDKAAFDYHLTTPHFHRWNDAVQGWLAEPAQASVARTVFLTESAS